MVEVGMAGAWPRVSVVIPTLNEARNLPYVFARLPVGVHEVIVVDGHSVDDTVAVARRLRPDVRIVTQTRSGKGNALACGFAAATGDIIATVDADGSADPEEISRFVDALLQGSDFAKGTRFAADGGSNDITPLRQLGNRLLSIIVNKCYGTRYSDLCYGFNAFWRRHVPVFGLDVSTPPPATGRPLWGDGFEVETLINIRVAKAGLVVAEVPSYERRRLHGVSNLSTLRDGVRVLRTILAERRLGRNLTPVIDVEALTPMVADAMPSASALLVAAGLAEALPDGIDRVGGDSDPGSPGQLHQADDPRYLGICSPRAGAGREPVTQ